MLAVPLALILLAAPTVDLVPHDPPPQSQAIRFARVPLEVLGGAAFGIGVGIGVTMLACAVSSNSGDDDIPPCLAALFITTPLMTPLGTWLVGTAMDGDGSLLGAYAGMGAALAMSGTMALALGNHFDDGPVPTTLSYTLALVGPAVGYELTSHAHKGHAISLTPMLGAHTQGFALAGTF